jgi:hypothetical protein
VKGVALEKDFALRLAKLEEHFRLNGLFGNNGRSTTAIDNQQYWYVRNEYAGTAPAFGCLQVTGTVEVGGQNYLKVNRPADATGAAGWYLFNGPSPIEQDEYGIAFDGPLCRMLTDGSTITAGGVWGPVASQFTLAPNGQLFVAAGADDIGTNVMKGLFKGGGTALVMKSSGGGIAVRSGNTLGSSATCTVWGRSGSTLSAGTRTESVYNLSTTAVANSVFIVAIETNIGWVAVWEDC